MPTKSGKSPVGESGRVSKSSPGPNPRVSRDLSHGKKNKLKKGKGGKWKQTDGSNPTESDLALDDNLSPPPGWDKGLTAAEKYGLPEWMAPCSYFFQQQGAIDFQSYLRLKREEKNAGVQFVAARKIQAVWRGFIARFKMRILHKAATKIQTFIRGFLARRRVGKLLKEQADIRYQKKLAEAATKIQAAWRGYYSRKTKLDFEQYKKIQEKNKALEKSIEKINKLEAALVEDADKKSESSLPSKRTSSTESRPDGGELGDEKTTTALEDLLHHSFTDLADNLSDSRVAELYAYATRSSSSARMDSFDCFSSPKGKGWHGGKKKIPPKKKPSDLSGGAIGDSLDAMFPEMPQKEGFVKPDPAKVEALKQAIRLLRLRIQTKEATEMQKLHYLLRTWAQPGVYSDIYCNKYTEFEKQLKSVKYWIAPPDPRVNRKNKNKTTASNNEGVSVIYTENREDRENNTTSSTVNFHGGEGEDQGEGDEVVGKLETEDAPDTNATTSFQLMDDYEMFPNKVAA